MRRLFVSESADISTFLQTVGNRLLNILLALGSLVVALVAAEFILRVLLFNDNAAFDFLRKPQLYADYERDATEHLYKEDYWKMRFLFHKPNDVGEPHPQLGWIGNFNPETYEHADELFSRGKRPVLLFGDSFSQCIDSTTCFQDYLNADTSFSKDYYLLNFGVGGYGIDQIHLLMEQALSRFEDPIVVFGMLTTDLDRSMLRFRDAPKPYFELDEEGLVLMGTPVKMNSQEYVETHPITVHSYVLRIFKNGLNWLLNTKLSEESRETIRNLNEAILEAQLGQLRAREIEPTVLLFQPTGQQENEWRYSFVNAFFQKHELEVIDTRQLLLDDMKSSKLSENQYFIPKDLHPNSYYNSVIAAELKRVVMAKQK